ncbi:serine hydrolase domain-containing protein [Amycolatopsis silviterrae]|uniref:Serine hydrolase domain-containing protein n=1 Tax=Amycolatopsis silviterrae TaxID=1656914 RepID=A0ABW5H9K5_9PSEU
MRRRAFGTVAAVVVAALAGLAGPASAETPAEILQAGAQAGVSVGYPGVVGLVRNGETAQYIHAGYGNITAKTPADPKAKFRIGSVTKAFTSAVLLQLEGEGKLSLDDTVARWLPGAVNANGNDGTKISVRQLLHQTSGLPEYASDSRFVNSYLANTNPRQAWPPQTLVNIATSHPPLGAPGAAFHYSNTNYVLAGMVIKAVTGNEPAIEVQRRIIEPLGLRDTSFPTDDPTLSGNYLNGYYISFGVFYKDFTVSNVQAFGAAGAIVSTEDDVATFERALLSGKLLPPQQQAELKTTVPADDAGTRYGLGIGLSPTPCGMAWNHSGAVLGYFNVWLTSDDGSKQVLVAANENHLPGSATRGQTTLANAALKAYCSF